MFKTFVILVSISFFPFYSSLFVIIIQQKVMRMLTCTMSKLVYGVDLSDLPQEKKGPRIKRLAGIFNLCNPHISILFVFQNNN